MEREVTVPHTWYVKCTPRGTFLDVNVEMEEAAKVISFAPTCVMLAVGTNDASQHMLMEHAEKHFHLLTANAVSLFQTAKVRHLL